MAKSMASQIKGKGPTLRVLPPVQDLVPGKPGNVIFHNKKTFPGNGSTPPILHGRHDKPPTLPVKDDACY